MESGGKAVTKRYRKKITVVLSLVLPVILLFAILNCFTTYVFYEDYKYKMNLMTEIAAKEEFSGLDAVSELLKDKDIETNEQGRRLLEQYGYWGNKGNAFYSQFRHQVMVTGAVSTVICVLLLTFLLYWKKKEDACHQKILDQLEEILIRFRENKFDDLLKTENHAELEKLNDQLEAIGHHIQLIKEEARAEKENTKEQMAVVEEEYPEIIEEDCNVFLSGCSSAFLGGDVIAGVMHIEKSRNTEVPERYMFLDLGTNGEMVLKDGERYLATSTACGPAFEGCARKQHAYGNSLLEAIALGRRLEKIHANGTLAEEFLDSGIVIHGIHINSEILQSIMLAKAAVYAGIKCLLKTAGLHARDIDKVYIAGGFGFYLNARDAIDLGMLPQDFMDKLEVVGNASLAGATDLLIHGPLSRDFEVYREKLQVIDLTQTEGFQDSLIDACSFVRLT